MKNRIIALFLAFLMLFMLVPSNFTDIYATNKISIKSKEDFISFSKKCTLDSYSQSKYFVLECDIDFSSDEFSPVPFFGGNFDGNGHTVSGIKLDLKGSYMGIFRYVANGAKVSNLNVKGKLSPGGAKNYIGGICGENSGTVENCTFDGKISGENVIGGICGLNTDSGRIIGCRTSGSVSGENSTGGICGKNSGFVADCTNDAEVNTMYEEKKKNISDIDADVGAIVENYKESENQAKEESILGHTDTGGITGFTSGILQGCTNNANIGCKHIGYNVGGICGRQSGYVLGCENYGFIQGRKDVGGICGQAEPYILLNSSESSLKNLRSELNSLSNEINKFITDADDLSDEAQAQLDFLSKNAKSARNNAEIMVNIGTDFADDNISEINAQAAILSNTLDKLVPVFDTLESGCDNLVDALDEMSSALDDLKISFPELGDDLDDLSEALKYLSHAERSLSKALSNFEDAEKDLSKSVQFINKTAVKKAFSNMSAAFKDIISAKKSVQSSIDKIKDILTSKPESFEAIGINAQKIAEELKNIKDKNDTIISSLETAKESIDTITLNTDIELSYIKAAAEDINIALDKISDSMYYLNRGLDKLTDSAISINDKLEDFADDIKDDVDNFKEKLTASLDDLSYAAEDIKKALDDTGDIVDDLSNEKPLEFVKLGDDFKNASEGLFDSVEGMSDNLKGLKNVFSNNKEKIKGDLTNINKLFNSVMNLLIDEVEDIKDGAKSFSDKFVDASDEDLENAKQGKLEDCRNFGKVEADRNIGGIVGAMAIEYSKDPEDDFEKPDSLNFTYRTRAILHGCINDGKITGKKDCTGGIAGNAEIGTIYKCENYGDTKSTDGNYAGGIAGKSTSAIRKSYSKSKVEGKKYVGGIAGSAKTLTSSGAIANVIGEENIGAICGFAEEKEKVYKNFFTDNGLGAIDGISYKEKAEPMAFDEIKKLSYGPSRFISFTVTFIADGKTVEEKYIEYGEDTAKIKMPKIPEKEGEFGKWTEISDKTVFQNIEVECEYKPFIKVIESKKKEGKLSVALADGNFTDDAEIRVKDSKTEPPSSFIGNVKVYDISLLHTDIKDNDAVKLRIVNPNKEKVTARVLKNGNWEKVKTSKRGKYVNITVNGTDNTVCVKYEKSAASAFVILLSVALLTFIIFIIWYLKKQKNLLSQKKL